MSRSTSSVKTSANEVDEVVGSYEDLEDNGDVDKERQAKMLV